MAYIEKLVEKREKTRANFNQIQKRKNLINNKEKSKDINSILGEDNTEEEYLIEFLKLKMKDSSEKEFNEYAEIFEVGIRKENFDSNFKVNFIKKTPYDKIIDLFDKYLNIYKEKNKYQKLIKMIEMLEIKNKIFKQTFPVSYTINKELYLNSLIYFLIKQIKDKCFKDDDDNSIENELIILKNEYYKKKEMVIKEIKLEDNNNALKEKSKKELQEQIENKKNKYNLEYEDDDNIEEDKKDEIHQDLKNIINKITEYLKPNFFKYMHNLSKFINDIYASFEYRFKDNNIFTKEEYSEIEQKADINLFTDFIYFIKNFEFAYGPLSDFTNIWNKTFTSFKPSNMEFNLKKVKFQTIKNVLYITVNNRKYEINNFNNYTGDDDFFSFLKSEVNDFKNPDCFKIINYLKMDKYDAIFIKLHWGKFREYVAEILNSKTIRSVFKTLYGDELLFPSENDLKNILDNIRFFNYKTDFVAETKNRFLFIYMQASIQEDLSYNIHIKKSVYFAIFLISCFHEIIGHFYIRIHNYLNKRISSPLPEILRSDYANSRGKEAGEYIEELLFGNYKFKMNMKEILFILDKQNYKTDFGEFRENFKNSAKSKLNISNEFQNILDLYDIELNQIEFNSGKTYSVNKDKHQKSYSFPQHHSLSQINTIDE